MPMMPSRGSSFAGCGAGAGWLVSLLLRGLFADVARTAELQSVRAIHRTAIELNVDMCVVCSEKQKCY